MKKRYFNLTLVALCLVVLTSCSRKFNFVTKGLPSTDSSYLITTEGKHIAAENIVVKPGNLTLNGEDYPLDSLSAIRSKKMYFGVSDSKLYLGDTYGKICLLYQMEYDSYNAGAAGGMGTQTTVSRIEYIQKKGSSEIVRLKPKSLVQYVSDNAEALNIAKASQTWGAIKTVSFIGFSGGILGGMLLYSGKDATQANANKAPLFFIGGSLLSCIISANIYDHKMHKAIRVYNNTPSKLVQ